jgi:DNA-binding transcriptional LysR family regulator
VSVIVDLLFTRGETKGWTIGPKVAKIATQRPTAWTITVLDFNDFFYFVQVVDRGGFTAAGRTLRIPKSTLSHRIQQLEANLGVRLLNRTSRRFGMTDAGEEFYRHAVVMLREAELAETAIRHRLNEPTGTVRCTAAVATMQFAMRDIVPDFLLHYPKVNVVAHATDQNVDIVGENYDVAIRAHSDPLPDSILVQRTLTPAPWLLFGGSAYLNAREEPQTPKDLQSHPSLFMMRTGVTPVWRLSNAAITRLAMVLTNCLKDREPRWLNRPPAMNRDFLWRVS